MNETASKLPEYPVVMAMEGVGPSLGPQLMAEIGDVTRFTHKGAITAFAGVDPGVNAFWRVFPEKRTCLQTRLTSITKNSVPDHGSADQEPSRMMPYICSWTRSDAQGKPYYVYMTAGANKFLRIYYGRVKEYLLNLSRIQIDHFMSFFRPTFLAVLF